jgi:hypothetical protein
MLDRSKKIVALFYATANNRKPVREWLLDLSKDDRRVIGKDIQKVEFGWPLGMPYCRSLRVRALGSKEQPGRRPDRAGDLLHREGRDGSVARIRKEDAEGAAARDRARAQAQTRDRGMRKKKGKIDRSETFDEFLAKDGILAEAEDAAIKEIIADQVKAAMHGKGLSKTTMARRMRTSRRQLDRLLDPKNQSVTLSTLRRAAKAVGRTLRVELA